ncbi:hypothetical protein BW716_10430 [[Flexibacter] sp. ATCC 35208]|nr:hypothetical protein BW716_10430 [[Flexibacter] sp. ATCC 35208]
MRKQLNEEEKRNQENPERRAENKSEHFIPGLATITLASPVITISKAYYTPLIIGYPISGSTSIFHPPGA